MDCIVVFGGEVDPSDRGHEGAGGFANDLIILNEDPLQIVEAKENRMDDTNIPPKRGWSSGDSFYDDGNHRLAIFGGLTGDDYHPIRLNDLWICTITNASTEN